MIISVASGKGGTGKTTVATNMALSVGIAMSNSPMPTYFFILCLIELKP
jgi:septum formation inhibitor-activating ATPase MinD